MRISLYKKSKDRADFNDILKKINSLDKPLPYIMNLFNCTYITASNFLKEAVGTKENKAEDCNLAFNNLVLRVEEKIRINPSFSTLNSLREDINKLSISVLRLLFKYYTEMDSKTEIKANLVFAIVYSIQLRYYSKIYKKEPSENLFLKTQELIKICC